MANKGLANFQHEEFCQRQSMAMFTKEEPYQSWLAVYGEEDGREEKNKKLSCSNLMRRMDVQDRIATLRNAALTKHEIALEYTMEKTLKFLGGVLEARPRDANMDNPLCELKMSKQGPYATFPDKLGVLNLLSKIKGWTTDVNVSVSVPSWSPSSEVNITEAPLEAEVVEPLQIAPESQEAPA